MVDFTSDGWRPRLRTSRDMGRVVTSFHHRSHSNLPSLCPCGIPMVPRGPVLDSPSPCVEEEGGRDTSGPGLQLTVHTDTHAAFLHTCHVCFPREEGGRLSHCAYDHAVGPTYSNGNNHFQ